MSSVRVKDTNPSLPPLERFLHTLHAHLMNSKSVSARQPLQASRELLKHGISIPYALPLPTEDSNWTVAYEKPGNVLVAGSWATKSGVKSRDNDIRWTVDLALEMPAVSSYSTSRRKGDLVNVNSLGVVSRKRLP